MEGIINALYMSDLCVPNNRANIGDIDLTGNRFEIGVAIISIAAASLVVERLRDTNHHKYLEHCLDNRKRYARSNDPAIALGGHGLHNIDFCIEKVATHTHPATVMPRCPSLRLNSCSFGITVVQVQRIGNQKEPRAKYRPEQNIAIDGAFLPCTFRHLCQYLKHSHRPLGILSPVY